MVLRLHFRCHLRRVGRLRQAKADLRGCLLQPHRPPVWTDIINSTQKEYPAGDTTPPDGAERIELCRKSGLRATDFCYEKVKDANNEIKSVRHTYYE